MQSNHWKALCCGLAAFGCLTGASRAQQVASFSSLDGTALIALVFHPSGAGASAAQVSGILTPQVTRGTVIALHGCDGLYADFNARNGQLNDRHQALADLMVADGYTVVFPDSFSPRGEVELCTQSLGARQIDQNQRRADVFAALAWVALQPWAKPERIALLGWSHGGTTLLAATDSNRPDVRSQAVKPALAVAFYPGCAASLKTGYTTSVPLVFMLGERDDWTPPEPCVELGKAIGAEVNLYADSHHGFDEPGGVVKTYLQIPNARHPGQGVRAGTNPVARQQSYARLRVLLARAIGQGN